MKLYTSYVRFLGLTENHNLIPSSNRNALPQIFNFMSTNAITPNIP